MSLQKGSGPTYEGKSYDCWGPPDRPCRITNLKLGLKADAKPEDPNAWSMSMQHPFDKNQWFDRGDITLEGGDLTWLKIPNFACAPNCGDRKCGEKEEPQTIWCSQGTNTVCFGIQGKCPDKIR